MRYQIITSAALVLACSASSLRAQWVSFSNETNSRVSASNALVAGDTQEKDYAWADLDQDGDTDLVIVRKSPFTSGGHFQNVLLMNENGVLTDRSSTLTMSTVPGSSAFLDATNDRDVCICDINGDGWLDVVTCTTLTSSMPKYIRVPRVYINQGESGGVWQGLLYDDENRIDDTPWGGHQRFCAVAAGDIDGDGDLDLYFGDYQQGGARPVDVNDRLLINDGSGYFTDESAARMTTVMLESSFGMQVDIQDMNGDGRLDIIKDDALNAPQGISISYNNSGTLGVFGDYEFAYNNTPYHFDIGDLNNDGRLDMIVSDDGQDRYTLNTGNGADGLANFTEFAFTYTGGGDDDGFAGNNLIVDLDNDGWNDAIFADVDVDIAGCNRRGHIFRNLGNAPNVTLQEQIVSGQVVGGITPAALQGTFDVAVFDIDGDGWKDMVVGRCTGTEVYINDPPTSITFTFVGGQQANITPGEVTDIEVDIVGLGGITPVTGSGELFYSINNAPYSSVAMSDNGAGRYSGTLPILNCTDSIRYYVSVDASNSVTYTDPPAAPAGSYEAFASFGQGILYQNDFEIAWGDWTVVNGAGLTNGAWENADPNGTINLGEIAAPFADAQSGGADRCFVTAQGQFLENPALNDVDGGPTDLVSPVLDYGGSDGTISFQAWLYSSVASTDPLLVQVTGDGSNWVTAMTIMPDFNGSSATNQWNAYSFKVGDYITPTATTQVRFRISDAGAGQILEAAIDVFSADFIDCNYCQPEFPVQTVGSATLEMCGDRITPGSTTALAVNGMPPFAVGLLVFDLVPAPTPWFGGELISAAPVLLGQAPTNASGNFEVPLQLGGILPPGFSLYLQAVYADNAQAQNVGITNALQVTWQ